MGLIPPPPPLLNNVKKKLWFWFGRASLIWQNLQSLQNRFSDICIPSICLRKDPLKYTNSTLIFSSQILEFCTPNVALEVSKFTRKRIWELVQDKLFMLDSEADNLSPKLASAFPLCKEHFGSSFLAWKRTSVIKLVQQGWIKWSFIEKLVNNTKRW